VNRTITIDLNGARVALHVEEKATLLDALRSELGGDEPAVRPRRRRMRHVRGADRR
jgi:hypothetical protein